MTKTHFLERYLMNPSHPITIAVVGCGGTGSYVVTQLAKMALALWELKEIQIHLVVYDNDKVEPHNVGRQLFSKSDVGEFKANVIVSRVNRFFGLRWESVTERLEVCPTANIIISCTDNVASRRMIHRSLKNKNKKVGGDDIQEFAHRFYWMDFGNSKDYGQYILATFGKIVQPDIENVVPKLRSVIDFYPKMKDVPEEPSCSMAESLQQQDLFINLTLAVNGIGLLWRLLKNHQIDYHGQFINLETGITRPIKIS